MQGTGSADLLVASSNPGKVAEIRRLLKPHDIQVIGLADLSDPPVLQEPYESFEENACAKASQGAEHVSMPALADDSGLVVDALDGRPGVRSSRYADTDAARIRRLLDEMTDVAPTHRGARFVCVVALAGPAGIMGMWRGVVEGRIATEPVGNSGFGYDPVFYYPPTGQTFAQMSEEEKNRVSHRGRALGKMLEDLPAILREQTNKTR